MMYYADDTMMTRHVAPDLAHLRRRYGLAALVTGASDGIGQAFARELARAGIDLLLVARRADRLDALAAELTAAHGVRCTPIAADLTQAQDIERVWAACEAEQGLGLFVAAAGFGTSGELAEADEEAELGMLDVNCRAVLQLTLRLSRRFVAQQRGGIVLLSSLLAFQGVARAAHYAATKAYIQTLAEGLRAELAPRDVDVIACAPGPIQSGFAQRADMQMGLTQTPDVVARATLRALGRQTTIRPGWLSKLLELSLMPLPRAGRSLILARVMGGMTDHQQRKAP